MVHKVFFLILKNFLRTIYSVQLCASFVVIRSLRVESTAPEVDAIQM